MDDQVVNRFIAFLVLVALSAPVVTAQENRSRQRRGNHVQPASHSRSRAADLPSPRRRASQSGIVRPAAHVAGVPGEVIHDHGAVHREVVHGGEVIYDDGFVDEGVYETGCDSCGDPSCSTGTCGPVFGPEDGFDLDICNSCFEPNRLCVCLPSHGWFQAEYLGWFQSGMDLPPLLVNSAPGTAAGDTGVLGLPSSTTIVGGNDIRTEGRSGGRFRFGWWFANRPNLGIEAEYFGLSSDSESTFNQGTGTPLLGRPFFNTVTGQNDAELVSSPGIVSGSFRTDATSDLDGVAIRFRKALCSGNGCSYSWLACGPVPTQSRIDATLGWRYLQLDESLLLQEAIDSQLTAEPGSFEIEDRFATRNQFNGVEMGVIWQGRRGYWSLDAIMRVSVGNVLQNVSISGSTNIQQPGQAAQSFNSGFLAQRSNIGEFRNEEFAVLPEWNATLGYQLTPRVRLTAGYTFIYLSNVVRPGDQIDLDINPNLLPPEQDLGNTAERPQFEFRQTDYWVQGVNLGAEYRW